MSTERGIYLLIQRTYFLLKNGCIPDHDIFFAVDFNACDAITKLKACAEN